MKTLVDQFFRKNVAKAVRFFFFCTIALYMYNTTSVYAFYGTFAAAVGSTMGGEGIDQGALTGNNIKDYSQVLPVVFAEKPQRHIFFDLGDTLIETSIVQILLHNPRLLPKILLYLATVRPAYDDLGKHLRGCLYEFLHAMKGFDADSIAQYDGHGMRIPQIIVDYMIGRYTAEALYKESEYFLQNNHHLFINRAHRWLVQESLKTPFSPINLANSFVFIEPMITLARQCRKQGHHLHILSNFDKETFELLRAHYPTIFGMFTRHFVSGSMGLAKPDPKIYAAVTQELSIRPDECIFFDDRIENIEAARASGWKVVLCEKNALGEINMDSIKQQFHAHLQTLDREESARTQNKYA